MIGLLIGFKTDEGLQTALRDVGFTEIANAREISFSQLNLITGFSSWPMKKNVVVICDLERGENSTAFQDLLRQLRQFLPMAVILAAYETSIPSEVLAGFLTHGGDDIVTKPIRATEVAMRAEILEKRSSESALSQTAKARASGASHISKTLGTDSVRLGDLIFDRDVRKLENSGSGKSEFLSPIDAKIISALMSAGGELIKRDQIKKACWPGDTVTDNAVNRKIHEVRRLLTKISECVEVKTVYGHGFALTVNERHSPR